MQRHCGADDFMEFNWYDTDWVCHDSSAHHGNNQPTLDPDEIYPGDSASNHGEEDYALFNDDFDDFPPCEKPVIESLKRKRSASEDSEDVEDMPPNIQNNPRDANVRQRKQLALAGKGTPAQGLYFDGRFKFAGDRRFLLELTRYTVRPDWGTPYPCYSKNLASYRSRPKRTRKSPFSNEVTTSKLVNFLNQDIVRGSVEHAAIHHLANGMQLVEWGPDLILKAFDDLDLVFFRGVLATRTQIGYMTEEEVKADGVRSPVLGYCRPLGYGRCQIVLNATAIFLKSRNPFAQMWATTLHEMVHGYLNVLCDYNIPSRIDLEMGEAWSVGGHGHCFRRIITAVDKRFRKYFNMYAVADWEPFNLDRCGVTRVHNLAHRRP